MSPQVFALEKNLVNFLIHLPDLSILNIAELCIVMNILFFFNCKRREKIYWRMDGGNNWLDQVFSSVTQCDISGH